MATAQTGPHASTARCTTYSRSTTRRRRSPSSLQKRDALIELHIGWAREVAAKVASKLPTWFHSDDLEGAAAIALLQSAAKYDPSRGIPFRAYAILHVQGACYSAARRNEYRERAHEELPEEAADQAADTSVERGELPAAVWQLPPDQFRVIQLCYLHGLTVEAAAERMRISASKASSHHRAALAALRDLMPDAVPRKASGKACTSTGQSKEAAG